MRANRLRWLAIALTVVIAAGFVVGMMSKAVSCSGCTPEANNRGADASSSTNLTPTEAPTGTSTENPLPVEESWYHVRNNDLQEDEDHSDDWNFGPNPWKDGLTVEEAVKDHASAYHEDPLQLACDITVVEAVVEQNDVSRADDAFIFERQKRFMSSQEEMAKAATALDTYLAGAEVYIVDIIDGKVTLQEKGISTVVTDQVQVKSYLINWEVGFAQPLVREFPSAEGHALVYVFNVKSRVVYVMFRIECGYQPLNVGEILPVDVEPADPTPAPTAKPTPTPGPTNTPRPTNTPKPTNTPRPTATPKPTNTPRPTNTPKPTATPTPTPSPTPGCNPGDGSDPGGNDDPTDPGPPTTPTPRPTVTPTPTPRPTQEPAPVAPTTEPSGDPWPGPGL